MKRYSLLFALLGLISIMALQCKPQLEPDVEQEKVQLAYWNHHDSVAYVGIETCMQCHGNVHSTFIKTGMGQSIGRADTAKSSAHIKGDSLLFDPYKDLYYRPHWRNNKLWLEEFRLQGSDTVHKLEQSIEYVIGSGQHTNSHLFESNGHFHQAPFTWYAQKGKLDFPPGFEDGQNSRFSRLIGLECMSCHNAMPTKFVMGSTNKFERIPEGINCERCHGPGAAHVAKIQRSEITDTSKEGDPSIVNPKRLSAQLQFEICQRCHLQGNAVLKPGKSFFDFKPGMKLKDVMQVFLPRYENSENRFIMASHVDRFKLSACYQSAPESFTCTSCHNPHLSVQKTNIETFNITCNSCHVKAQNPFCSETKSKRLEVNNNCVQCHMPPSSATDIPHVTVHDHFIRKPQALFDILKSENGTFLSLKAINDTKPSPRDKALAYLQQYERFGAKPFYLDSAQYFLNAMNPKTEEHLYLWAYFYFLAQDLEQLYQIGAQYGLASLKSKLHTASYDNKDAWTAYRLAEAFKAKGAESEALELYQRATELAPFIGDFKNKWAALLFKQKRVAKAEILWKEVLLDEPYHKEALNNLGYLYLQSRRLTEAKRYLDLCLKRYPDYLLAWQNLGSYALQSQDAVILKKSLEQILRLAPGNEQALSLYKTHF